jgi:hypothetical protein
MPDLERAPHPSVAEIYVPLGEANGQSQVACFGPASERGMRLYVGGGGGVIGSVTRAEAGGVSRASKLSMAALSFLYLIIANQR